jgi:hypothetical protein
MVVDATGIGLKATLTTRKLILGPERERNPTFSQGSSITFGLIIGVLTERQIVLPFVRQSDTSRHRLGFR